MYNLIVVKLDPKTLQETARFLKWQSPVAPLNTARVIRDYYNQPRWDETLASVTGITRMHNEVSNHAIP